MGGGLFEPHSQGLSSSRPLEMGRRETLGTRFRLFVNEIWGAYIRKADLNFFFEGEGGTYYPNITEQ